MKPWAIAKGEAAPAGKYVPETVDVAAIRKKQKLTQEAFAHRFGLPLGTVRDWEQKRRLPDRAATILLTVIDKDPSAVTQALSEH